MFIFSRFFFKQILLEATLLQATRYYLTLSLLSGMLFSHLLREMICRCHSFLFEQFWYMNKMESTQKCKSATSKVGRVKGTIDLLCRDLHSNDYASSDNFVFKIFEIFKCSLANQWMSLGEFKNLSVTLWMLKCW